MSAAPSHDPQAAFAFTDAGEWETWLTDNHPLATEAWLVIARKGFETTGLTIAEAADVGLCFGWIDSLRKARDARSFLQRYSPRRPSTPWSRVNVDRAEVLIAQGRMRPAGLAQIEAARADGRWAAAYAPQAGLETPADVEAALQADSDAAEVFGHLSKSARYAMLLPILRAVRYKTRAARILKMIDALRPEP